MGSAEGPEWPRLFCEAEYPRLAGYCLALTADENLARDIAQESFLRLLSRWPRPARPRAYLFTIATNLIRRHWRRTRSEAAAVRELRVEAYGQDAQEPHAVHDLIDRLPPSLRTTIILYYFADLPIADIARALRVPQGTVKRRLYQARIQLRESWLSSEPEPSWIKRGD